MNLTKGQKTMLALFLAVVALVIVLWVTGVFNQSSGFKNNNRSGSRFGRVNNQKSLQFGRVNNRSSFGAIGTSTNSGPVAFNINYTNPGSFGKMNGIDSIWNGVLLSLSTGTTIASSQPNADTSGVALASTNKFYENKYKSALTDYYGTTYSSSLTKDGTGAAYRAYANLPATAKIVLQANLNSYLAAATLSIPANNDAITLTSVPGIPTPSPTDQTTIKTEIIRLLKLISAFRPSAFTIDTASTYSFTSTNGSVDGVYAVLGATVKTKGATVNLITVKQTTWLDFTGGNSFNFGVGIINNNLTAPGTGDGLKFPFMVSNVFEYSGTVGSSEIVGDPSGLTVSTSFW